MTFKTYTKTAIATTLIVTTSSSVIAQQGPPDGKPYTSVPSVPIKKCINLGNMFETPKGENWGGRLPVEQDFSEISALGFDTVRLPVRWSDYAYNQAPYQIDPDFFDKIDEVVGWATKHKLNIIIDLHHYDEIFTDPAAHSDRFVGLWKQIAEHYKDQPKSVMFELLNEPHNKLTNDIVEPLLARTLAEVRKTNPTRKVIMGGENWSGIDSLKTFDPPKDRNVIATFHFYEPFNFSHQGAEWIKPKAPPAPASFGSDADYAWLDKMQKASIDFMQRTGVPLFLGEFGSIQTANITDRAKHSFAIRKTAEAMNIGWCAWAYTNTFSIRNDEGWIFEMVAALGMGKKEEVSASKATNAQPEK